MGKSNSAHMGVSPIPSTIGFKSRVVRARSPTVYLAVFLTFLDFPTIII